MSLGGQAWRPEERHIVETNPHSRKIRRPRGSKRTERGPERRLGLPVTAVLLAAFVVLLSGCISSFTPTSGTTLGGSTVDIKGSGFTGASAVKFGSTTAKSYTVTSSTSIKAVTKSHAAGTVRISVTTTGGLETSPDYFAFVTPPTLTSFAPTSGSTLGGTPITITGTHFTGATAVKLGSTTARSYTVTSSTTIKAVTGSHAAGTVKVSVTTAGGTATSTSEYKFVNTGSAATYTLRSGFPHYWDTYPWTSTITTVAVGDLIVVYLHANTTTGHVKSVQDSNDRITWHSAASIAGTDSTHLDQRLELWIGVVKSVGSTKITSTWTGSTADYFIYVWEFSSSLGSSAKWSVTASAFKTHGTTGPQTVTWPSLTSGPTGGIWVGTAYPGTKSSDVTTTPGFTYVFDVHGNPLVERVTLAADTAYAPKVKQTGGIRLYDAICLIAVAT